MAAPQYTGGGFVAGKTYTLGNGVQYTAPSDGSTFGAFGEPIVAPAAAPAGVGSGGGSTSMGATPAPPTSSASTAPLENIGTFSPMAPETSNVSPASAGSAPGTDTEALLSAFKSMQPKSEGWAQQGMTQLATPGAGMMPPSGRALSSLGRAVY